ncbi:kinase-like protein, partial [Auriscalpium vulgare]
MGTLENAVSTDATDPQEEPLSAYEHGGFHPARVDDLLSSGRYRLKRKLGWGMYSIVWLARDEQMKRYVAIKILSARSTRATPELAILSKVANSSEEHPGRMHVTVMLDSFSHTGPNGTHDCFVFEVLGPTVLQLSGRDTDSCLPLMPIREISRQLFSGLDYLHSVCGVVHTDLKLSNIMAALDDVESTVQDDLRSNPPEELVDAATSNTVVRYKSQPIAASDGLVMKIADFGVANMISDHFMEMVQPAALRAPEVILGAPWNEKVDIWSVGCLIYELANGRALFGPWPTEGFPWEAMHLLDIQALFGPFPIDLVRRGSRSKN